MPTIGKGTQTSLSEINMIPFIDVVLVLLIIFMITAPILQSGIEVDVPKTKTVREIIEQRIVVTVDKGQKVYIGNDPVNIHQLGSKLKSQLKKPKMQYFYVAMKRYRLERLATVIDTLRQSGISNISIVTQPITDRQKTN